MNDTIVLDIDLAKDVFQIRRIRGCLVADSFRALLARSFTTQSGYVMF